MSTWTTFIEKQHQPWDWIKDSLLLIQKHLYMGVLHKFSACSLFVLLNEWFWIILQCTSEGVYIRFPSQTLKLSNLDLNIYLPALNLINASYLIQTRAYGSRSATIQQALLHKGSFKTCATFPKHFQNLILFIPADLLLDMLARLLSLRCSCIILLDLKTFMGSYPWAPAQSVHASVSLLLSPNWHPPLDDSSIWPDTQSTAFA